MVSQLSSTWFGLSILSRCSLWKEKQSLSQKLVKRNFETRVRHICTRVLLNTHTHFKAYYSRLNMSFASTIANRAALATRVVSQVTKSSNNKRRSLIVKAEGDVPAETEKPAAAAPAVRFFTSSLWFFYARACIGGRGKRISVLMGNRDVGTRFSRVDSDTVKFESLSPFCALFWYAPGAEIRLISLKGKF